MEEWLKFSEPLRLMPARAFLTLVHAFTTVRLVQSGTQSSATHAAQEFCRQLVAAAL